MKMLDVDNDDEGWYDGDRWWIMIMGDDGVLSQRDHLKEFGDGKSYCITRNRTNELIEKAKTEFYSTLINENQNNSIKLWGYINELAPKDSKQTPSSLVVDGHKSQIPWK